MVLLQAKGQDISILECDQQRCGNRKQRINRLSAGCKDQPALFNNHLNKHVRIPQNQNLSKMREVLKYGIFDISSMSTKGFWLTYVKTSFFVYFRYIFAIFLQISFVPYLTSACPAVLSSKRASWLARLLMSLLTILPRGMASS